GEAAQRAAAVSDAQGGEKGADGSGEPGPAAEGEVLLDEQWGKVFDALDDGESELAAAGSSTFDVDEGWRDDAVTWTRKLAGADAPEGLDVRREEERLREA